MQIQGLKVFFSYARTDSNFVLKLAEDMRSAGVDLWIDQLDIPAGARWDQSVENALKACPRLLIILSSASIASQNVMDEVAFAIDQSKQILPVLYQNCDIPFRLKRLQHIDFTGNYDKAFTKLLTAIDASSPDEGSETLSAKPYFPQRRIVIILGIIIIIVLVGLGGRLIANWIKIFDVPGQTSPPSSSLNAVTPTCDLTGIWKNVTTGGASFRLFQSGNVINFTYLTPGFNHFGNGIYNPDDNSFLIRQNRVEKATRCKTQGNVTVKVINCNKLVSTATWDSANCGVPRSEGPFTSERE